MESPFCGPSWLSLVTSWNSLYKMGLFPPSSPHGLLPPDEFGWVKVLTLFICRI
jgi:hypothetical protein